jgi:hypothetical protein
MVTMNALTLLSLREQQRNHWSGILNNLLGFIIIASAAIWGFFGHSYSVNIGHPAITGLFFLIAGGISSLILGLWRLYAHYIDDHITQLYPEILPYEGQLGVAPISGIWGYLTRYIAAFRKSLLLDSLNLEQKVELVRKLGKLKLLSSRGHLVFDISVLVLIACFIAFSFHILGKYYEGYLSVHPPYYVLLPLIVMLCGLALASVALGAFHRSPTRTEIERIISEVKKGT